MDAIEDHHHRECLYIKSALETMPEVLEALSTALCRATLWQVVGGTGQAGRANLLMSGLGPAITPVRVARQDEVGPHLRLAPSWRHASFAETCSSSAPVAESGRTLEFEAHPSFEKNAFLSI